MRFVEERKEEGRRMVATRSLDATEAITGFWPGIRLTGVTKGQFSLIDLIKAVLEHTGPADLILSTWTQGVRDVDNVAFLVGRGILRSLLLLTDRSFVTRKPDYCGRVTEVFGDHAIYCTQTHAKFALIRNETWDVCIRSSMNLNRNHQFEQFDIDDDHALCEFFMGHVREMTELVPGGFDVAKNEVRRAFEAASLGDGISPWMESPDEEKTEKKLKRKRWRVPAEM